MSSRGRVCRRVVSVRPVSAGANEGWKGRLRPKCNIMLSSLFPNESTSQALYCPLLPSITLRVGGTLRPGVGRLGARSGPGPGRWITINSRAPFTINFTGLKKAHQPPRGQLMGLSKCNAHWRARTADQSIKSALLYQLS